MARRSLSGEELELHELTNLDDDDGKGSDEHQELATQRYDLYSPEEDKKVLKKLDRRVVLFIAFLYLLSFLDRSSEYRSISYKCGLYLMMAFRHWQRPHRWPPR